MNKKKIFIIIGTFWIVLIGGLIGITEFTLKTGNEVLLKIRPADPRDFFRGDYVVLRYKISIIDSNAFISNVSDFKVNDKIYVTLNIDKDNIGNVSSISKQVPVTGNFIKGTVKNANEYSLTIEYGIERYFVPEGKGKEIERNREKIFAKVAIDKYGNAVIKSLIMDGKEVNLN